jgi:hypothetical protein
MKRRPQDVAADQLALAEIQLFAKMRAMKRLVTSIAFWQRRCAYYAKRSMMTDAQLSDLNAKRKVNKPTRVPRGIKL